MANSGAHRLPDHHHHHRHHHPHIRNPAHSLGSAASLPAQANSVITHGDGLQVGGQVGGGGGGGGSNSIGGSSSTSRTHFKGHQRRQSVARLLPDISKLRLLSWLVEASSELINCDITIMDGVYAKLNRSRESLLFWDRNSQATVVAQLQSPTRPTSNNNNRPPPPPSVQPVANSMILISQEQQQQQRQQQQVRKLSQQQLLLRKQRISSGSSSSRNHHSLPITNYDASSLAAVSMSPSLGPQPLPRKSAPSATSRPRRKMTSDTESLLSSFRVPGYGRQASSMEASAVVAGTPAAAAVAGSSGQQTENNSGGSSKQPMSSLDATCNLQANRPQTTINDHLCDDDNNNNNNNDDFCDSNQSADDDDNNDDDDDDDNISAASSSSGIHGGETSLSSAGSNSGGSSSSAASTASGDVPPVRPSSVSTTIGGGGQQLPEINNGHLMSSAELLSEKIRRTVMKHNYLQSLLVNVIRQHDRQRDQMNLQRRRQMSIDQFNLNRIHQQQQQQQQQQRIDLADIADAIDDGCFCLCHSSRLKRDIRPLPLFNGGTGKSSTLPPPISRHHEQQQQGSPVMVASSCNQAPISPPSTAAAPSARKIRRLKKARANSSDGELNRQDMINLLADKLCENCFETHYWLHGCWQELALRQVPSTKNHGGNQRNPDTTSSSNTISSSSSSSNHNNTNISSQDLNAIIAKRNATFIKFVQQEVRSTISKSIELIDLIRKEIKLPESIKQKQLMRCFSTSIQLLTSVGNYVVPAQDISSFIPEVLGQQETTLFSLPSSDFDHLLLYPSNHHHSNNNSQQHSNYHLAQAPEIPLRSEITSTAAAGVVSSQKNEEDNRVAEQALSSNLQRLKTGDTSNAGNQATQDSSSGASSNNSSASSSIARGAVQQSSLTRAQTSSAILDGKTSHGLSFEAIANLSRQQTDDDILYQSRPKFWQSSKFNFIKKLLHVKEQRLLRQQSKDRRIYNNKVQNKFRLVMMDLTHFNKSQQLLTTENGVNSLLTSMRNVLEFGLYLTLKLY